MLKKFTLICLFIALFFYVSCSNSDSDNLDLENNAAVYYLSQKGTYFDDYNKFCSNKSKWSELNNYSFKLEKTILNMGNQSFYMSVSVKNGILSADYSHCPGYREGVEYKYEPFCNINSISDWFNYIDSYYKKSIEFTNTTKATKETISIEWDEIDGIQYPAAASFTSENFEPYIQVLLTKSPLFAATDTASSVRYKIKDIIIDK